MTTTINDFSMLCRLFGNLFYRNPQDSILKPVLQWLHQGNLTALWALTTDSQSEHALQQLQNSVNNEKLQVDYQALFGEHGTVSNEITTYSNNLAEFISFRKQHAMDDLAQPNHVAHLLLCASWLEDNLDANNVQKQLFEQFLLPIMNTFLGKVEAHDQAFYRALAQLCRDALSAMADELEEIEETVKASPISSSSC